MENILHIINKLNQNSCPCKIIGQFSESEVGIGMPIYWSEDINGNINYDIESIKEAFESLIVELENHNKLNE